MCEINLRKNTHLMKTKKTNKKQIFFYCWLKEKIKIFKFLPGPNFY